MIAIIEYLTPHVILDQNEKLYQKDDWGALYKPSYRILKQSFKES